MGTAPSLAAGRPCIYRKAIMATERKIDIKISSVIDNLSESGLTEGDQERSEISPAGTLEVRDDGIVLRYTEESEGGRVEGEIIIGGERVAVIRRGAVESEMLFSEGKSHTSLYKVPPYSFDTVIFTKRIRRALDENSGRLDILYTMNIGGQNKNVRMKIEYR